ncbi:ANTAR domain-containing protein [Amycolatopsis sp. NPDC059657]|uniref:ANTAR domain-containing protein n=1 Tax=Amycolatopsis sp. NPDC059657 TaxID=3346899 RepID=UPI00366D46C3
MRRSDVTARVLSWVIEQADADQMSIGVPALCQAAARRLGVSGASLTVNASSGWSELRHATDFLAERLAELQVTVGEGPCADARRDSDPVLVDDLSLPECRQWWPVFTPLAVEQGASALFALPLGFGAVEIGVLALHRIVAGRLSGTELADALVFADLAMTLLIDEEATVTHGPDDDEEIPLHDAQVHQATGMLTVQLGVSARDAFVCLRARAFAEHRPLSAVAADVVARRLQFDKKDEQ